MNITEDEAFYAQLTPFDDFTGICATRYWASTIQNSKKGSEAVWKLRMQARQDKALSCFSC